MAIATQNQSSQLARDNSGKYVEGVSLLNWRPARKSVTKAAWVNLSDGSPRSAIYIKNEDTAESIILSPVDDDSITNDITDDNSGILLGPGKSIEPSFGAKLGVFARIEAAGGAGPIRVAVVESF